MKLYQKSMQANAGKLNLAPIPQVRNQDRKRRALCELSVFLLVKINHKGQKSAPRKIYPNLILL
jgi:hypothetical protein